MEMKTKPYEVYGIADLLMIIDIRDRITKLEYWETIDELVDVASICKSFEVAWRLQDKEFAYETAMRRMDDAWDKLNDRHLFH